MATTRLMPLHTGKGRTVGQAISDIIDYTENPQKTDGGRLITSWQCDSRIADAEFLFTKNQYIQKTGRVRGEDDVIAYHLRQSFVPGEITPEDANRLGCELAKRFTKGNHAYIVCTHIDKAHIHNHVIWNSTALSQTRKFRNFWGSSRAVRRLNDTICIENGYSIVENPKRHGKSYNKWLGDKKKPSHRERICAAIDDVPAGIILLIADLLLIPGLWLSFRMVRKYGKEKNDICAENVSSIVEYVSGIQTFRAYGVGGMKNKTVINAMREFCRISFVYEAKVLPIGAGFGILSWLSCPLVIWLSYAPWIAGTLNTVDYLLICMLPLFCAKLANSIFVDLTSYKNLMISKNKILGVMNEPEETGSMEPLQIATHEITFDSVDFSYVPGEPVLKHATFTVPDQKLTAIVGDSGSGKSTILNLIAKYYEATGGTISIGGKPINHVAAERVLEQISMVDQDVFLFDDTIRENIQHARPEATDEEIEAACREANCDGFIRKMEKGYDTPTGENGNLLSGGERQRISIARAILKNSPILLLDEATASLDIENELAVKRAIANLLKEKKTVVMIAHTLSIVKNADQILVVSGGKIAEAGTHDELLAKGGKYAAMWNAEQKLSA